jgi:glycosyltransferase involved in cell wall biosynthesis
MTRVSLVVDNHNYAGYLQAAIDSCLAQSWPDVETVVVDDGSTDSSRKVIAGYDGRLVAVLQPNGGQASAFVAGLRASSGDVVIYLDADDVLLPEAASSAARAFDDCPGAVKISWPMWEIDACGRRTGATTPDRPLPRGDLRPVLAEQGADSYLSPPTSGNAWARSFLSRVLPAPREDFRRGADGYLITLAPLFGLVVALDEPRSCYRVHGRNGFWKGSLEERVTGSLERHEVRARALAAAQRSLGMDIGHAGINAHLEWLRRLDRTLATVRSTLPAGERFLLVDGGEWGDQLLADRSHVPFTERRGVYWGPPVDDAAAAEELRRHVIEGVRHVVVGWPAFWWLDEYPAMRAPLEPVRITEDVHVYQVAAVGTS